MNLRDDIRNYEFTSKLPKEVIKTSREYVALAILKYSFSEYFSKLHKAETSGGGAYVGYDEKKNPTKTQAQIDDINSAVAKKINYMSKTETDISLQ